MIPNIRIQGKICKTNTMSNSAFRGFGGPQVSRYATTADKSLTFAALPQGMMMNECIMTRVAEKLDMPVETLREKNMYKEGDRTHFGQEILDWNVPTLFKQVRESSDFDKRKAAVEAFNAKHKYRKRGISILPTKFGISFTAIFLNQAHALVNIFQHDGSVSLWHGESRLP
jgi:xanthine dehydrogenase/oxidase